jgi:hypothetical protein
MRYVVGELWEATMSSDYPTRDGLGNVIIGSSNPSGADVRGGVQKSWNNLAADTEGEVFKLPNHNDKTVQGYGVFGGALLKFKGTLDERAETAPETATWFYLRNEAGEVITFDGTGDETEGEFVAQNPTYIKAVTEGGDGTTDINGRLNATRG